MYLHCADSLRSSLKNEFKERLGSEMEAVMNVLPVTT